MAGHANELVIPTEAELDTKAGELLRAWVVKGALHCSLKPTVWPDPGNWGILLADVARHVARAMQLHDGRLPTETIARITHVFNAEIETPTDKPNGEFHQQH